MARRSSGRRTDYEWGNFGDSIVALDQLASGTIGPIFASFSVAGTLVRIRGKVGATLNTAAVGEHVMLLLGLTVISNDAAAAGVVPEILNDVNAIDDGNWVWQGAIYLSSGDEGAVVSDMLMGSIDIDTKAMRRFKASDALVFVAQAPPLLGVDQGGTIDLSYYIHNLIGR